MVRDPRAPNRRQDSRCLGACSVGGDTAKLVAALQGLERSHQARDGRLSGPRCQSDGYRYRSTSVAASASCGSPDLTRPHQLVRASPSASPQPELWSPRRPPRTGAGSSTRIDRHRREPRRGRRRRNRGCIPSVATAADALVEDDLAPCLAPVPRSPRRGEHVTRRRTRTAGRAKPHIRPAGCGAGRRRRPRASARPSGAGNLAAILATCHQRRQTGRGRESIRVARERGQTDAPAGNPAAALRWRRPPPTNEPT